MITVTFPPLKSLSLDLAYSLYAAFALLSLLFVAKYVKETKGMSLEDMDAASGVIPLHRTEGAAGAADA